MNGIRLLPVLLSLLLLAAHFLRSGTWFAMGIPLALGLLLLLRRPWVARTLQVAMVIAAAEWVRTLWEVASFRRARGLPWTRMAVILGAVALLALLSALVFRGRALRERYRINGA